MPQPRTIPDPVTGSDTQRYWQAASAGKLLVGHCADCDKAHFYPRPHCPFCFGARVDWVAASGRGVIYSFSILRRVQTPYCLAYVTLQEGPCMMTNIVDCDLDTIRIGAAVRLVFHTSAGGQAVPMFTLAETG